MRRLSCPSVCWPYLGAGLGGLGATPFMQEVTAPLAGFARPGPAIGGQGRGVGNQFLPGEHETMGGCELKDFFGRLNLLELAAKIAMLMHKIFKSKKGIRHAEARSKSLGWPELG